MEFTSRFSRHICVLALWLGVIPYSGATIMAVKEGQRNQRAVPIFSEKAPNLRETPLWRFVRTPDKSFKWERSEPANDDSSHIVRLELVSQKWREHIWKHQILLAKPSKVRHPDSALLLITGSRTLDRYRPYLLGLAEQSGTIAAVVNNVPNQPFYDGRKEDALIAYTFQQYLKTGDESWPLLFPMVKSAVRAMDALSGFSQSESGPRLNRVILTGASKRGWTTWLTGPVDRRVVGIAPMVFDILNMHAQSAWAEMCWGKQSVEISDYTEAGLVGQSEDPRRKALYSWIDPFVQRRLYSMPKLILLGANDPYWVVDSTRHYYPDLVEPKAIHQTPNLGHDIGRSRPMFHTLGAFAENVLNGDSLPRVIVRKRGGNLQSSELEIRTSAPAKSMRIWTTKSSDRDFRDARWKSTSLRPGKGRTLARYRVPLPLNGYKAVMFEARFETSSGRDYGLTSEVIVVPDNLLPEGNRLGDDQTRQIARLPTTREDTRFWLNNAVGHHGYSISETMGAIAFTADEMKTELKQEKIQPFAHSNPADGLKVLPFPGGWHPRVGFREGAIDPQRETKVSVFTPWDPKSFVVVDVPEAIWSNLGLTYLAHTHVPTIWTQKGVNLKQLEWNRHPDGTYDVERTLPNGIRFTAKVTPREDDVAMRLTLHNGTGEKLTGMRVQNCVMLRGAHEFAAQHKENKIFRGPFAACRNDAGNRWVITAWTPIHRAWGNDLCPCLHADPKFPDAEPGQTVEVNGWLSFHEGTDIDAEIERLRKRWSIPGE